MRLHLKLLTSAILLLCSASAFADCENILPTKEPQPEGSIRLCRAQESYLTVYNPSCKVPYYSAELIGPDTVNGNNPRANNFREDVLLPPKARSTLADYRNSGYDRGHMAPAADFKYSNLAMSESFLLSNMIPQFHNPNAGIWSEAESFARSRASRGATRVISGPLFEAHPIQTIGDNVCVPTSTFKIIFEESGNTTAFIVPNAQKIPKSARLDQFVVPVEEVEQRSGMTFR